MHPDYPENCTVFGNTSFVVTFTVQSSLTNHSEPKRDPSCGIRMGFTGADCRASWAPWWDPPVPWAKRLPGPPDGTESTDVFALDVAAMVGRDGYGTGCYAITGWCVDWRGANQTWVSTLGRNLRLVIVPEPRCGNGVVDRSDAWSEQCDSELPAAHCHDCRCLPGTVPVAGTTGCSFCGNGVVDEGEQCDSVPGCSRATCLCGEGFEAMGGNATGRCQPVCGNGRLDEGEQCDPADGTGHCAANCTCTPGSIPVVGGGCSLCGNRVVDAGEHCDWAFDKNCLPNCTACSNNTAVSDITNPICTNITVSKGSDFKSYFNEFVGTLVGCCLGAMAVTVIGVTIVVLRSRKAAAEANVPLETDEDGHFEAVPASLCLNHNNTSGSAGLVVVPSPLSGISPELSPPGAHVSGAQATAVSAATRAQLGAQRVAAQSVAEPPRIPTAPSSVFSYANISGANRSASSGLQGASGPQVQVQLQPLVGAHQLYDAAGMPIVAVALSYPMAALSSSSSSSSAMQLHLQPQSVLSAGARQQQQPPASGVVMAAAGSVSEISVVLMGVVLTVVALLAASSLSPSSAAPRAAPATWASMSPNYPELARVAVGRPFLMRFSISSALTANVSGPGNSVCSIYAGVRVGGWGGWWRFVGEQDATWVGDGGADGSADEFELDAAAFLRSHGHREGAYELSGWCSDVGLRRDIWLTNMDLNFRLEVLPEPRCGNGALEPWGGEQCDSPSPLCANCSCANGTVPLNDSGVCSYCGNGILDAGEQCDSVPGCDNLTCLCLEGFQPAGGSCILTCGNGKRDEGEDCDYYAAEASHCRANCTCESGYVPEPQGGAGCTLCGNGVSDFALGEACEWTLDEHCLPNCSGCSRGLDVVFLPGRGTVCRRQVTLNVPMLVGVVVGCCLVTLAVTAIGVSVAFFWYYRARVAPNIPLETGDGRFEPVPLLQLANQNDRLPADPLAISPALQGVVLSPAVAPLPAIAAAFQEPEPLPPPPSSCEQADSGTGWLSDPPHIPVAPASLFSSVERGGVASESRESSPDNWRCPPCEPTLLPCELPLKDPQLPPDVFDPTSLLSPAPALLPWYVQHTLGLYSRQQWL
eukprot:m51a1_g1575 putative protein kinase domain containing protein (1096) ;mRNA; r:90710-95066